MTLGKALRVRVTSVAYSEAMQPCGISTTYVCVGDIPYVEASRSQGN